MFWIFKHSSKNRVSNYNYKTLSVTGATNDAAGSVNFGFIVTPIILYVDLLRVI